MPDVFSKVLSSDAKFETVSSNLAKKLKLFRKDTVVGHKRMIYAIDVSDETRKLTRKVTTDFFKSHLGFLDSEIIFVNRKEFGKDEYGNRATRFTADT